LFTGKQAGNLGGTMFFKTIITHRVGGKIMERDQHSQEYQIMHLYGFLNNLQEAGFKIDHWETRFGVSVLATRRNGDCETTMELVHYK